MFASDEEALAAGVDLYQRVLDAEVKYVNGDPGSEDEYRGLVVNEKWSSFQESSNKLKDSGAKFNGRMTADPIRLQQLRQGTDGVKMTFYACLDLSQAKVIDANGAPLEPKSINKRGYMVVDAETQDGTLRLSSVKQWSQDSC